MTDWRRNGEWAKGRKGVSATRRGGEFRREALIPSPFRRFAHTPFRLSPLPALATEAATRDYSALDAYSGRTHASAEVRSRNSQVLVCAL